MFHCPTGLQLVLAICPLQKGDCPCAHTPWHDAERQVSFCAAQFTVTNCPCAVHEVTVCPLQ
jgi:hypothetical protein